MNKPSIFLDCDETLLYSRSNTPGASAFRFHKESYDSYTSARESAYPFLEAIKGRYNIYLMTQGHIDFQRAALTQAGLVDYFDDFYGYHGSMYNPTPKPPETIPEKWLLVDNRPADDPILQDKRLWLSVYAFRDGVNFLQCEEYWGGPECVAPLTDLLPAIYEILG